MDKKTLAALALSAGLILGVVAVELLGDALAANVSLGTADSTKTQIRNGEFWMLDDGGVRLSLCGRTRLVEDGGFVHIINGQSPCTVVNPGAAAGAFINYINGGAVSAWNTDHGL